jgi:quercetin dioxygenase-like cupin family protein
MKYVPKIVALFAFLALGAWAAAADDPVKVAPDIYKATLENQYVRVLDIHLPAKGKSPMHSHPAYIIYAQSAGDVRFTLPDGQTKEAHLDAGQAVFSEAESHAVDNLTDNELHVLNVELRQSPPAPPAASAAEPDPVKIAPDHYKVLLDNDRVRVLEITDKPGDKIAMHAHPAMVIYALEPVQTKFTYPDGKTQDFKLEKGQAVWSDPLSHSTENIGATGTHLIVFELKPARPGQAPVAQADQSPLAQASAELAAARQSQHLVVTPSQLNWIAAPPSLPPGAQMAVLEGDMTKPGPFTARFKAPANYKIPPHWHPADEHITVLSGTFYIGMGDRLDESTASTLPAGSYTVMPAKHHHFAFTKEETVIQLHGIGPWGITYINPADNPQK